jgi:hypothetical protein
MCPLCFVVLMARIFLQFRRFALLQLLHAASCCLQFLCFGEEGEMPTDEARRGTGFERVSRVETFD